MSTTCPFRVLLCETQLGIVARWIVEFSLRNYFGLESSMVEPFSVSFHYSNNNEAICSQLDKADQTCVGSSSCLRIDGRGAVRRQSCITFIGDRTQYMIKAVLCLRLVHSCMVEHDRLHYAYERRVDMVFCVSELCWVWIVSSECSENTRRSHEWLSLKLTEIRQCISVS